MGLDVNLLWLVLMVLIDNGYKPQEKQEIEM